MNIGKDKEMNIGKDKEMNIDKEMNQIGKDINIDKEMNIGIGKDKEMNIKIDADRDTEMNQISKEMDIMKSLLGENTLFGYYFYIDNCIKLQVHSENKHINYAIIPIPIYLKNNVIGGAIIHRSRKQIYLYFVMHNNNMINIESNIRNIFINIIGGYSIYSSFSSYGSLNLHNPSYNNLSLNIKSINNIYFVGYFFDKIINYNMLFSDVIKVLCPKSKIYLSIQEIIYMITRLNNIFLKNKY
jgi:hypothetical protein